MLSLGKLGGNELNYSSDIDLLFVYDASGETAGPKRITNKEFYFIVTAADGNSAALEPTIEGFRAFISCLTRAKEKGVIYGAGAFEAGEILASRAMKQAYEMGKAL